MQKLGALVDSEHGVVVFTKIDPGVPIQLEEHGGHFYLSLVDDLLKNKVHDEEKLTNFRAVAANIGAWQCQATASAGGPGMDSTIAECKEADSHPSPPSAIRDAGKGHAMQE
eukprot:6228131-Lingulodinium_polyedra.AAC.1